MDVINKIDRIINELRVNNYNEEFISSGDFIKLKIGNYELNNGKSIDRESIVRCFGSGNAACVFAVTDSNKILLVITPRIVLPTKDKVSIEIPAGYIEDDEDSVEAAKRELEEETGYTTDRIWKVDSYYPSLGISGVRIDLFLAVDCVKNSVQNLDDDEFLICEEVSMDEFKYLVDNNYIMDVNSRIGYFHYLNYLKEKSDEK